MMIPLRSIDTQLLCIHAGCVSKHSSDTCHPALSGHDMMYIASHMQFRGFPYGSVPLY
ncbi:unnamed protein product [Amoebophrya sp. A25]|nr:unnamed protein product [Amoebophrya sp. A25]|eukprot:GSA25T00018907001.1